MSPLLWLALCATAPSHAHPFGAAFAAHHSHLDLTPQRIAVTYQVDVPAGLVAGRDEADAHARMERELRAGLVLLVDGTTRPLTPVAPATVEPEEDAVRFTLELQTGPLDGWHEVELSVGNLPEVPGWYAFRATLDPALAVSSTSLVRREKGHTLDDSGRFQMGPEHSRARVSVVDRQPLWAAIDRGRGTQRRTLAEAGTPDPIRIEALAVALLVVGLAAAAALTRRRQPR